MIHEALMKECQLVVPKLKWTVNFYKKNNDTGTVYEESGPMPDTYDFRWRYPEYMIYIRAKDWDLAREYAQSVFDALHGKLNFRVTEQDRIFYIQSLYALSEIIRIGADENDNMEYSINFRATIREEK